MSPSMRHTYTLLGVTLAVFLARPTFGEAVTGADSPPLFLRNAETIADLDGAATAAVEDRRKTINDAMAILRNEGTDPERKARAIYVLGEFRSVESVSLLKDVVTFSPAMDGPARTEREWGPWGTFPAADALIKIGYDSVPAMIEILESSDALDVRKLSLEVIRGVFRGDLGMVRIVLEHAASAQKEPAKKQRLQLALDAL